MGYHQAGFDDIVGIDNMPQPNYPFEFIQADALNPPLDLDGFDLIHASPPCQAYSVAASIHGNADTHPDLVEDTRHLLEGHPYVMENVPGAPLRRDVVICGSMFPELAVRRHRIFETSEPWVVLTPPCEHSRPKYTVFGHSVLRLGHREDASDRERFPLRQRQSIEDGRRAMDIQWMNRGELSEAIPPAYTKFIGEQFLAQ
jgi:DNA (cytosine-5)-methyltransferase 1